MIEHALGYARLGWAILPVWPAISGGCSCPADHPSRVDGQCKSPGKHPRNARGLAEATSDEGQIRAWWTRWPDASIAVAMARSGLLALDVDGYHGDREKIARLEAALGALPDGPVQASGSGNGWHLIYRAPAFPVSGVIEGVVVRARAYCVLAPSTHASGGRYSWLRAGAIVDLPEAWLAALRRAPSASSAGVPGEADEAPWLRAIGAGDRLLAASEHLAREPGERKGEDRAGTAFNVCRSVCRGFAIRDPEAALALLVAEYNPKCAPPYDERELARRVVGAYEDAEEPEWGALLRPPEDLRREVLAEIGLAPRPHVPGTAPGPPVSPTALASALRAAAGNLVRRKDPAAVLEGELLGRALRFEMLGGLGDDPEELAARAFAAAARAAPPGTTPEQLIVLLSPSMRASGIDDVAPAAERAIVEATAERALVEERKAVRAEARKKVDDPATDEDLRARLSPGKDGEGVASTGKNVERILRWSQETRGRLRWNELTKAVTVDGGAFADVAGSDLPVALRNWLESEWNLHSSTAAVGEQMLLVARRWGAHDPLSAYLDGLAWDGVPRVETWLPRYCGADDTRYNRLVGAMWLVSAVARGRSPGAKVDTVLVLEGEQGTKKSTALKVLGGGWFSDTPLVLGDKDSRQVAGMRWIIELAELASLRGRDSEALKAFLSSSEDNFRPPYGRIVETFPRRCVFAGTTNEAEYLHDPTGARRFWCVKVTACDVEALAADRDQIWAEAAHLHAQGMRWWFDFAEQREVADAVTADRRAEDPWATLLAAWWDRLSAERRRAPFALKDAGDALGIEARDLPRHAAAIGRALRDAGFASSRHGNVRAWSRP